MFYIQVKSVMWNLIICGTCLCVKFNQFLRLKLKDPPLLLHFNNVICFLYFQHFWRNVASIYYIVLLHRWNFTHFSLNRLLVVQMIFNSIKELLIWPGTLCLHPKGFPEQWQRRKFTEVFLRFWVVSSKMLGSNLGSNKGNAP